SPPVHTNPILGGPFFLREQPAVGVKCTGEINIYLRVSPEPGNSPINCCIKTVRRNRIVF
ncbi:MAG: hypothetical protein LBJ20_08015, partial [Candidatus Methanoplasma sp.]|nr:hypothetical protein [Candidatus Methanoplasma sp.]